MRFPKRAVISAAGVGSRLGLNIPKCLVEIKGKTLIERQLSVLEDFEEVRIVVGFRADDVIDVVLPLRRDAVFVFNHRYRDTTNSDSLYLAARTMQSGFVALDGDLLIEPLSFRHFTDHINREEVLVGICEARTEEAVYVEINDEHRLERFSVNSENRNGETLNYEWAGVCYFPQAEEIKPVGGFVYKVIEGLDRSKKTFDLNVAEIDTPLDLAMAEKWIEKWG